MATKKPAEKKTPDPVEALRVKSRSANGFYRCGMKFTPDATYLVEGDIDHDQAEILMEDPDLMCKVIMINPETQEEV